MHRNGKLLALVLLAGLSAGAVAAEFSYSYLEVLGDLSKTKNTAPAPLEDNSDGELFGVGGSLEVFGPFYVKGAWSRETKDFSNEVARTPLDLDSKQTVIALGAGYHLKTGEKTSLYAEAMAIVDFEVEHSVPLVTPSAFGPPTVSTTDSVIDGNGFSAALGVRHWITKNVELEGQFSRIRTSGDVTRTGAEISDWETMYRIGAQAHLAAGLSVGGYFSYSKHTDDNFNNIRKLGVALRYHF